MIVDRRSFLKTASVASIVVATLPISTLLPKSELELFVKRLRDEGPDWIPVIYEDTESTQKITVNDLGLSLRENAYRKAIEFIGPDGVYFGRYTFDYVIDVIGKPNIEAARIETDRLAIKKLRKDIEMYYVPERRDDSFFIPDIYPEYPATYINGRTVV